MVFARHQKHGSCETLKFPIRHRVINCEDVIFCVDVGVEAFRSFTVFLFFPFQGLVKSFLLQGFQVYLKKEKKVQQCNSIKCHTHICMFSKGSFLSAKKKKLQHIVFPCVPHHSTDYAINCLTAQIGRDAVGLVVYGRNLKVSVFHQHISNARPQRIFSFSTSEGELSPNNNNNTHTLNATLQRFFFFFFFFFFSSGGEDCLKQHNIHC